MKKYFLFLLLCFTCYFGYSGQKNYSTIYKPVKTDIEYFAKYLLEDKGFVNTLSIFTNNSLAISKNIIDKAGPDGYKKFEELTVNNDNEGLINFYAENNIDTNKINEAFCESLSSWFQFLSDNPKFAELSMEDQLAVFKK